MLVRTGSQVRMFKASGLKYGPAGSGGGRIQGQHSLSPPAAQTHNSVITREPPYFIELGWVGGWIFYLYFVLENQ